MYPISAVTPQLDSALKPLIAFPEADGSPEISVYREGNSSRTRLTRALMTFTGAPMHGFAEITETDVIQIMGPDYAIDALWEREFGHQVEYRYRAIPKQLVYLLCKYGPVIPHRTFVESISEVCAVTKCKADTGELVPDNLSDEAAEQLIEMARKLGLITVVTPQSDRRYRLYRLTEDQLNKLRRIEQGAAEVYRYTAIQASNPTDFAAGKDAKNASIYRHVIPEMVRRYNEVFKNDKSRLDKLRYLIASWTIVAITLTPYIAAAMTLSGGTK